MLLLLLYSRELISAHCCLISTYAKAKYKRYHAGEDGWDQIVAAAAGSSALPSGFPQTVKAAPTPAELAVMTVRENDPATLSFSDCKSYRWVDSLQSVSSYARDGKSNARQMIISSVPAIAL